MDPNNPHDPYTIQWDAHERQVKERKRQQDEDYYRRLDSIRSSWPGSGGIDTGGSVGGGGGNSGGSSYSGPGVLDGFVDACVSSGVWFVEHIWPLRVLKDFGVAMAESTDNWKLNAPMALIGCVLLPAVLIGPEAAFPAVGAAVVSVAGEFAGLMLVGLGGFAGWMLVPALGLALILSAGLVGIAIALALVSGIIWLGWQILSQL